ncbi:MAG TPA: hypothetical protein VK021_06600, partial [Flavobacteriaceae bacterium]|nr:hypothetical protein [Flavobacteriaceae bacterium]
EEIAHISQEVSRVYFYGAGCGTEKNKTRLKRFLEKYFRRASSEVHEDLMGACLSVTNTFGIVCILGTGSNSCLFDGKDLETHTPSMGYILMDEASGNYFGKRLLRDYYYKDMPLDIAQEFAKKHELIPYKVKENLYKKDNPNAYLANFAKFIFSYDSMPEYFENMLRKGLNIYFDKWVAPFSQTQELPIHFVGSIAFYSKNIIAEILEERGWELGNIQQNPIDSLTIYFQNKIKKELEDSAE